MSTSNGSKSSCSSYASLFTEKDKAISSDENERLNYSRLIRLLMGVGVDTLRNFFKSIHVNWENQPFDASALKKGSLKLLPHQEKAFYSGNINEWDVTLLISVLRFTTKCAAKVKRDSYIDNALQGIATVRNTIVHLRGEKMSDDDFEKQWEKLKANIIVLGCSETEIDEVLEDRTERSLEQYKMLFSEEVAVRQHYYKKNCSDAEIRKGEKQEEDVQDAIPNPEWDAWTQLLRGMNNFNQSQTNLVLVSDVMTSDESENFKVLAAVPWSMVIDFDPNSEDEGLYKTFNSQALLPLMLSPFTPGRIGKINVSVLQRKIDSKRILWLFANGRKIDDKESQPKFFPAWERQDVKNIAKFFVCCADSFDKQKPIRCLALPISPSALPFVEVTMKRFFEHFSDFNISSISIDNSCENSSLNKDIQVFAMSSSDLNKGMKQLFNFREDSLKYEMPCFQSELRVSLTQKNYVYMKEYLKLFYIGCEQKFMYPDDEKKQKKTIEEHRASFLSGNSISFLSLYFNHDAKRSKEKDIEIHIQRMIDQRLLKHSSIVQIAHSPGTGGSTIAKRVLWNLHNNFPCASVKLSDDFNFEDETNFLPELSNRIATLEDECGVSPVILVDGRRQWKVDLLSHSIVRSLNSLGKRAVILQCCHGSKVSPNGDVHKVFQINSNLEDNPDDLKEFKEKYNVNDQIARRVFHFPLLSMMKEFSAKLKEIVTNTLYDLSDLEKNIAGLVAFLQIYADQPTPAFLLYEMFRSQLRIDKGVQVTYQDIKKCFSNDLLNLMIRQERESNARYTLQHHVVATILFKKYLEKRRQNLYEYVFWFLNSSPINNMNKFVELYCDLFLFNKGGTKGRNFSFLIEELGSFSKTKTAKIFRKAAEIIPDPRPCGHAARYHARMSPPKFQEAEELISKGIKLSETYGRVKSIHDSKGILLSIMLRHKVQYNEIKDIECLESLANIAISEFRFARDFPPTFTSPLLGEVDVWTSCIQWIIQDHDSDVEKAVKYILNGAPSFFRTCISDSFNLLDIVDDIMFSTVSIQADLSELRQRTQNLRLTLICFLTNEGWRNRNRVFKSHGNVFALIGNYKLPKISSKEAKRIRAQVLLKSNRNQPLKKNEMSELMKLLNDLVIDEKEVSFASSFISLSLEGNGPKFQSMERLWKVCRDWLEVPNLLDPKRFYFTMVMAFIHILNGEDRNEYIAEYKRMVTKLKELSRTHCRSYRFVHFLKKNGKGESQLVPASDYLSYKTEDLETESFWKEYSRQKLKECAGRLRVHTKGTKKVTKIELLEGGIELHVNKDDIGVPDKDFNEDSKVYFVVGFQLIEPVAKGITFHPYEQSKKT